MSSEVKEIVPVGSKFKTSAVGLVATSKPTWGEWEVALTVVSGITRSCQWWLGDMLNLGFHSFGEKYSQAINELGYDPGYLRNLSYVCERVQLSLRSDKLTFSHHTLVAPLEAAEQKKWITLAVNNGWTVQQLREAMRGNDAENAEEAFEGDDELEEVVHGIEEYLDGLADDGERLVAVRGLERRLRTLEKKYGGKA
jgi:hypothetical protein